MDSSQGIPVEYKLDAFNMPRTGTTLCHPKIGYVDPSHNPALDTLALNSLLGHLNGDSARLSTRRTKIMVTLKFNSYNCNMSFVKMQRTQSLTCLTTHAAISTFSTSHNSISSQYSQPFTSLAAPKANPIFHAANKNLFTKIYFDYRHLTSSLYLYLPLKLSEGTNNTKRGNNTT